MKTTFRFTIMCLAVCAVCATHLSAQNVNMWQQDLTLPTYEIGQPDPNSIFFTGRAYQGAQGRIYPYPLYDVLTDEKVDKPYNALYLENEYMKVCVLPEMGGRILSATDKTNGYEMFYRQTGIKPALIGMLGAWLSGGVEWNFPHHHRPSSYMAIDWKTEENADGSKTIWIGETELNHRIKWSIGVTVHPNRSWVEARVRIMNRSPFIQSMLYWANVSVHANEDYEVIFPPSTQFGTDHSKVAFTRWPYRDGNTGETNDPHLAWWKNFTSGSRSIFAWNFEDDFLAGYDHGREAGTVHVANHHIVGGKKFFLWGNNASGEMWNKMLSDNDGHYLELMVGAYSDNQPDYSWINPGETREFTQRWYPIRDIGSVKNATDDAAVNLERTAKDSVFVGFNATTKYINAKVTLTNKEEVLLQETITIDPSKPYIKSIVVPADAKDSEICATLTDNNGNVLVSYCPVVLTEQPMPEIVRSTGQPSDYETNEELYLAGLRIEQFHNARLNPMDFYNEALRRDSLDSRVNTVVGIRYARLGQWQQAEEHLQRALIRPNKGYTTVKDPEPYYYLGVVYQYQRRLSEAANAYWKATWYPTFQHPAYYALAQIASLQGDYKKALELVQQSINVGMQDTKALTLQAYLLRKSGKTQEAAAVVKQTLNIDPLDYSILYEQSLLKGTGTSFLASEQKYRGAGFISLQELLEVSLDYANIGAYTEASALLDAAVKIGEPFVSSPLVYYYNSYFQHQLGNEQQAAALLQQAAGQPSAYCFPFRLEELAILANANDSKGQFYLGNLYYYFEQKDKGIALWEQSVKTDPTFARAARNLGFGYSQTGERNQAIAAYEQSVKADPTDPRVFIELDQLYEQAGKSAKERLAIYEKNLKTIMKHDDAVIRLLTLYNENGLYTKATAITDKRHFHVWEGGGGVHGVYVDAHLLQGIKLLESKKYQAAIKEFELADQYPDNLEVGRPANGGHNTKVFYYMGEAYRLSGDADKARTAYETASEGLQGRRGNRSGRGSVSDNAYFQAQALKALGKTDEANRIIQQLQENIEQQLNEPVMLDEYSKFGEDGTRSTRLANLHYLKGLVALHNGNTTEAQTAFREAIRLNPDLIWAKQFTK